MKSFDEIVLCPYCGELAELMDSAEIYGMSFGWIWACAPCRAYVGCHGMTKKPLGRLADAELREYKKKAHAAFDPVWKTGKMSRGQAYKRLSKKLGIPREDCHIGMFDVDMCKRVIGMEEIG